MYRQLTVYKSVVIDLIGQLSRDVVGSEYNIVFKALVIVLMG